MALARTLIESGYFPKEIPPAFSTSSYGGALGQLPAKLEAIGQKWSRCIFHSIPRLQNSRRLLGIPNPLHQYRLALAIESRWAELEVHMKKSPLSLTRLEVNATPPRALNRVGDFDDLDTVRVLKSSASRYLLKADLSRFYHTLYTHSVPWALHSKAVAKTRRNDKALAGNLLDEAVRQTQDQQTLGIPVGPDTSDLISELLGVALDMELLAAIPELENAGARFVDDYYLYFSTRSKAESALAELHRAANHFAVEINPLKTIIRELPEPLQPSWKADLRSRVIRPEQERGDLLDFFSIAYGNATAHPGNNVLKYAVKHSTSRTISHENWELYEAFLLGALVSEPGLAPTMAPILVKYRDEGYELSGERLKDSLAEVASYNARLRQGFEVAWALWLCKLFSVELPDESMAEVSRVDDPIVALLALSLRDEGLANSLDTSTWSRHMQADQLYSENWLLAYEAYIKGWLPSADGSDYVGADNFFGILLGNAVEFYDSVTCVPAIETGWLVGY